MRDFHKLLAGEVGYRQLLEGVRRCQTPQLAAGLSAVHKAHVIHALCADLGRTAHIITPNEPSALKLCEDLGAFLGEDAVAFFPAREFIFRDVEGASREYENSRLGVLGRILNRDCPVVVSSGESAVQYTLPGDVFQARTAVLKQGERYDLATLISLLVLAGYERSEQVEGVAQFAVRGGILDFMPPGATAPYRVEFWGDEIDTIALFDTGTQRRTSDTDKAEITPARESLIPGITSFIEQLSELMKGLRGKYGSLAKEHIRRDIETLGDDRALVSADRYLPVLYDKPATLFDYTADRLLFVCEPTAVLEALKNGAWQQQEDIRHMMSEGILFKGCDKFYLDGVDLTSLITARETILLDTFTRSVPDVSLAGMANLNAVQLSVWSGDLGLLEEDLREYMHREYSVAVLAGTRRAADALCADLSRDGFDAVASGDLSAVTPGRIYVLPGSLSAGMEYPNLKLAVITHTKAAPQTFKRRKRHKEGKRVKALSDLTIGDYVVHSSHGIGVFDGIVKRDMHGVVKDYIKIRYAGTDALFVPVTQLDLVSRYIGAADGVNVRLNKLNSAEWQKTRARVKGAVADMAKDLIALYANRMNTPGFAFSSDSDWQREFEFRFPFEETDDQLRCVEEIKTDMQRPAPMDRLLCGDVGFGKTEVALRAIFKCVTDSKQCAVLVPTTILAWQHYQTFTQRMEGYPITIELLSRFKTPKEQKDIVSRLSKGQVDVVIGTHRVVQKDIKFKDLGLCVIDEEQRFGVAHKEKFKELRANVDVLTLSATPIPRTLNMAMSGIRDMSLIEEAPQDRYPVQTYVLEHDYGILVQAMQRELRRGGQVFYLHNRIETIDGCSMRLQEMMPEARIATVHGKIGEEALSDIWRRLVDHEIDILVCTTIIETGVDVPNCNTLIIEDSDRMGLAQLYQIRGRVGRSTRRAYAFFTFRRGKVVSEIAAKRLSAIREFTTFGSGFRIAMRDLEIRGAGNVLGAQQHGHMAAVGYDLYLQMLAEAVSEQTGQDVRKPTECVIDVRLDAHIPENYIENLTQRIDIYKKIASVMTKEDALDITDELIDRFGEPPDAVRGLIDVALLRNTASGLGISEISQTEQQVILYPETLDIAAASHLASRLRGRVKVNAGQRPYFSVLIPKGESPVDTIRESLSLMLEAPRAS